MDKEWKWKVLTFLIFIALLLFWIFFLNEICWWFHDFESGRTPYN